MSAPLSLLLIAAACLVVLSVKRIPEGQAYTVHRFGRYRRTLDAGVHWILPLVERIAHRISLTGRTLQLAPHKVGAYEARGTVWYQVVDAARAEADAGQLDDRLLEATRRSLAWVVGQGVPAGAALDGAVKRALNLELRRFGLVATRCQLQLDHPAAARDAA